MADVVPEPVSNVLADIQCGGALSLAAAGRLFPGHRGGRAVNPSTIFRWVTKGLTGPFGTVIRLEAARVGGRWLTSSAALCRFVAALTAASTPSSDSPAPPSTPSPAERQRASDRAAAALEAAGA